MAGSKSAPLQLLIVVLCGVVVWLVYKMPPPKRELRAPELLPIKEVAPTWDGSYPYLVIRIVDSETGPLRFESAVSHTKPTVRHESPVNEFQVDLHSGMFVLRQTDLFVADTMPLVLTRTYRPWDYTSMAFGAGTNHPYDIYPSRTRFPYTYSDLNLEDGRQIHFPRISRGTGYADAVFRHYETSSEFYGAQDAWNGDGWTLDFRDGRRFLFPENYYGKRHAQGAATDVGDGAGHHIQVKRDQLRNLQQLISPAGHTISFNYDGLNRIVEASDDAGNVRKYTYDTTGHLDTISDANRLLYRFRFEPLLKARGYDSYLMTSIENGEGKVLLRNEYADHSRVSAQRLANGQIFRYNYLFGPRLDIVETTVTLPNGSQQRFLFREGRPVGKR